MAPEEQLEQQAAPAKSSMMRMGIIAGIVILVPAILALALFNFVFRPYLAGDEAAAQPKRPAQESHPASAVAYEFPEAQATVVAQDFDTAAPLLIYQVALICDGPRTLGVIEQRNTWFNAMVGKLHRNRTRAELNDPYVQETILRQVRDEANSLLEKFAPRGDHHVIEAMYLKFAIFDL